MFFSKKKQSADEAIKYRCIGVNYFDSLETDDETKEALLKDFETAKKIFTNEELNKISEFVSYNVKKAFIWAPVSFFTDKNTFDLSLEYRFKRKAQAPLSEEDLNACLREIRVDKPYNRSEIETLSARFGFSVYDRLLWERMKKITLKSPGKEETYTYFEKSNPM